MIGNSSSARDKPAGSPNRHMVSSKGSSLSFEDQLAWGWYRWYGVPIKLR